MALPTQPLPPSSRNNFFLSNYSLMFILKVFLSSIFLSGTSNGDASVTGNCLSQFIDFSDTSRVFNLQGVIPSAANSLNDLSALIDTSRYDFTIDYGNPGQVSFPGTGVNLNISQNPIAGADPVGTRISSTRFLQYGRISVSMSAITVPGVVSTFITCGPNLPDPVLAQLPASSVSNVTGDEIDFEFLGTSNLTGTSNVFYRGILEYGKHNSLYSVPNGIGAKNQFTIDWKHDSITWSLNGKILRVYNKNGSEANSEFLPSSRYFPDRPQKIQFGVWSEAANSWAGGAAKWPPGVTTAAMKVDWLNITCYDNNDKSVPKWPNSTDNPDRLATFPGQPIAAVQPAPGSAPSVIANGAIIPINAAPGQENATITTSSSFNSFSSSGVTSTNFRALLIPLVLSLIFL